MDLPDDLADASESGKFTPQFGWNPALRLALLSRSGLEPESAQVAGRVDDLSTVQLLETLRTDQLGRWQAGKPIWAHSYLATFPELDSDPEAALDLIWSEYMIREARGDRPDLESYAREFPQYESLLRRQFEVHKWVEEAEESEDSRATSDVSLGDIPTPDFASGQETPQGQREPRRNGPTFQLPGFEVLDVIGRGGMGVVYKARQLSLDRIVALKLLPPAFAAEPERQHRFRTEAAIAARLSDSRILPVYDILENQGAFILVMPYVDGWDLARILEDRQAVQRGEPPEGRHPCGPMDEHGYLRFVLPLLDQAVAAVAAVHAAGVLHRDLKPSNILVDRRGEVRLTDFGLARLGPEARITNSGQQLGTPGFMAPEQWAGQEDIDARADVFGLGATLYQALTFKLPYGQAQIDSRSPPPIRARKGGAQVPAGLYPVILKALEPDRRYRYNSAAEMQEDWGRAREGRLPIPRRPSASRRLIRRLQRHPLWGINGMALGIALAGAGVFALRNELPQDTSLAAPDSTPTVLLDTNPPGARAVFVPLDQTDGEPRPERAIRPTTMTPVRVPLPPGDYLVEVGIVGLGFHEVFRHVPHPGETPGALRHARSIRLRNGSVELPSIEIPAVAATVGMARFEGSESFVMGTDRIKWVPPHVRKIDPFLLDTAETTVGDYRRGAGGLPPQLRDQPPVDSFPITYVQYGQALDYAERIGKRLPTESEYEFAATMGGTRQYPWGDAPSPLEQGPWSFGLVRAQTYDRTATAPPVFGLYSNVAEWTTSWLTAYPSAVATMLPGYQNTRVVRGGPASVVKGAPKDGEVAKGPRWRHVYSQEQQQPGLGFRCARSVAPRFLDMTITKK